MTVGQTRLAEWLQKSGFTGRQAARLIGMHYAHLSQVLNGHRRPGLDLAFAIEAATRIDARDWIKPLSLTPKALTRVGKPGRQPYKRRAPAAAKRRVSQVLTA
jgi:transcriptional regulator with XRE-family HTH domain